MKLEESSANEITSDSVLLDERPRLQLSALGCELKAHPRSLTYRLVNKDCLLAEIRVIYQPAEIDSGPQHPSEVLTGFADAFAIAMRNRTDD